MGTEKIKRFKLVIGYARVDSEETPDIKDFDTALSNAVDELYVPIYQTLRVTRVEGNIMFTILTKLQTDPLFIGGGIDGQVQEQTG